MMLRHFWPLLTTLLFVFCFLFSPSQLWVMCCSSSGGFQSRCGWMEGYWISAVFTQVLQWDGSALSRKWRDWETEENRRKALEQHWADPTSNMMHIDNIYPFRPFQTAIGQPSLKTVQTHKHVCVCVCGGCSDHSEGEDGNEISRNRLEELCDFNTNGDFSVQTNFCPVSCWVSISFSFYSHFRALHRKRIMKH